MSIRWSRTRRKGRKFKRWKKVWIGRQYVEMKVEEGKKKGNEVKIIKSLRNTALKKKEEKRRSKKSHTYIQWIRDKHQITCRTRWRTMNPAPQFPSLLQFPSFAFHPRLARARRSTWGHLNLFGGIATPANTWEQHAPTPGNTSNARTPRILVCAATQTVNLVLLGYLHCTITTATVTAAIYTIIHSLWPVPIFTVTFTCNCHANGKGRYCSRNGNDHKQIIPSLVT